MPLMGPPPILIYDDLESWVQSLLTQAGPAVSSTFPTFNKGPYIPEMPDELFTLTLTGGTGFQMEGSADAPTFQVRVRSQQNHQKTAELIIATFDKLVFQAQYPTVLSSGLNLLLVSRVGGAPDSIGPPDDAYRYDYVCNYYAIVGAQ
jgi:hypothetical protein